MYVPKTRKVDYAIKHVCVLSKKFQNFTDYAEKITTKTGIYYRFLERIYNKKFSKYPSDELEIIS